MTKALFVLLVGVMSLMNLHAEEKTNTVATVVKNVDAKEAAKIVASGTVIVLDVRTAEEFADGHIAGATNINFMAKNFAAQVGQLDRNKTYLLHCASGSRSKRCLPQLKQLGFKEIIHLDGGMGAWEDAGNSVVKK